MSSCWQTLTRTEQAALSSFHTAAKVRINFDVFLGPYCISLYELILCIELRLVIPFFDLISPSIDPVFRHIQFDVH